jgi:hypothetical protein
VSVSTLRSCRFGCLTREYARRATRYGVQLSSREVGLQTDTDASKLHMSNTSHITRTYEFVIEGIINLTSLLYDISFPFLLLLLFYSNRPPLSSNGQSFWPQAQRSGFDSRNYQIFSEVVVLERGPLSLVSTTEELLERIKKRLRSRKPRLRP